ncbi:hypothetical protein NEOLEDRAFT_1245785 [Neolentinus lepideus HHB14362 ss-1]|uniref:Uncharacterized protein n=1 Tax=Neolentinus lepideus HHB14362 ss-1 TaxID=1314782 RepID=A0A165NEB2_9AGAM|nr:hypothetical protein NEOLEDRAFT_1245785 [Neolentinus lepideus HHB14362 ss-1]
MSQSQHQTTRRPRRRPARAPAPQTAQSPDASIEIVMPPPEFFMTRRQTHETKATTESTQPQPIADTGLDMDPASTQRPFQRSRRLPPPTQQQPRLDPLIQGMMNNIWKELHPLKKSVDELTRRVEIMEERLSPSEWTIGEVGAEVRGLRDITAVLGGRLRLVEGNIAACQENLREDHGQLAAEEACETKNSRED